MYKNNCSILGLTKGSCKFTTSDFPAENPRTQTRNYSYTRSLNELYIILPKANKNPLCFFSKQKLSYSQTKSLFTNLQ